MQNSWIILEKTNFFSVLSDGSTNCTINEQECTFELYFDDKDKVKIKMGFWGLQLPIDSRRW